jgi:hypothetical protein
VSGQPGSGCLPSVPKLCVLCWLFYIAISITVAFWPMGVLDDECAN